MGRADKLLRHAEPHLEPGEVAKAAVMGAYETQSLGQDRIRNGVLIATDRRVLFYSKKLGGFEMESFPYGNISSFEHGKSLMGHSLTLYASGNKVQAKWLQPADEFNAVLDVVKAAMSAKHAAAPTLASPPPASAPMTDDVMQKLRQLGELRDSGVLTPEEFDAKKADLLGRI